MATTSRSLEQNKKAKRDAVTTARLWPLPGFPTSRMLSSVTGRAVYTRSPESRWCPGLETSLA